MPGVAVLGGGYAGLRAARRLRAALDRSWTITLVERSLCHQLITRLPEIVGAGLPPERACIPYERLLRRGVHLMRAEVTAVDPVEMRVETSAGTVKADCLVVALGTVPDFLNVPGAKEYGLVLKSVEAATALRARIEELCRRQPALHIGIVGAGYTGTELAGELMKWSRELERSSAGHRIEVTVVAQDARLLPEGNVRLARVAESVLRRKGVALRLGTGVTRVEPNCIQVGAATAVKADLVIWATRARAAEFIQDGPWRLRPDGRIAADPYLRAEGFENVYVAGDIASIYDYRRDRAVPASAQAGLAEASLVARNILRQAQQEPLLEFEPRLVGEALALGDDAVAEVAGVVVAGAAARTVKQAALWRYLYDLGGRSLVTDYR